MKKIHLFWRIFKFKHKNSVLNQKFPLYIKSSTFNSLKHDLTQLFLVEHAVGHFEDVAGRDGFHLLNDVVHVLDGFAHDERTGRTQQLVHTAFVAQGDLPDELLLGMVQLQGT